MCDDLAKLILFGEDFTDADFAGFNLTNFLSLEDVGVDKVDINKHDKTKIEKDKDKRLIIKKKLGIHKDEGNIVTKTKENKEEQPLIRKREPQEKDLGLKLMCVSEGEKIYKLSDLFIPNDSRIIKKIEKYNNKEMELSEKLKQEKDTDSQSPFPKKELSEAEEMKHLVRKAKRNQKYTKINVTYNEKFFLENIITDKLSNTSVQDNNLNIPNAFITTKKNENFKTIISNEHSQIDRNNNIINDRLIESNLLNSLFSVQTMLKEEKKIKKNENFQLPEYEDKQDDRDDILELNKIIKENAEKFNESFKMNLNRSYTFNDTYVNKTSTVGNILEISDFKMFTLDKSNLFKDLNIISNDNKMSLFNENKDNVSNNENSLVNTIYIDNTNIADIVLKEQSKTEIPFFKSEKENIDVSDLYDNIKKKRYRAQGYYNEFMLNFSSFKDYLIFNDERVSLGYKDMSRRIYDLNDYNMNFEVLKPNQKKELKEAIRELNHMSGSNGGLYSGEDFFTNLVNQKLIASNGTQQQLKIGNAKGNLLTHAKCAYNLTYNKINLTYDDLKDFHRPNFPKLLLKDKKKRNFSITISDKFNISTNSKNKRWDCTILTRNYLKKKEKKRISRNIEYMNAYEIFKDRYKLSLIDGKFCLFEHIDENPLFLSNFGMASKLKKFIYTSKLLNANVSNSSTKLTENEMKTYNIIGPYGIQIPLQQNQKLPLIGQVDINEIKGLSVIDNKMYRAPVFYEKLKQPVVHESGNNNPSKKYLNFMITFKKSKEGKESFYIREIDHHYTVAQEEPKIEVYPPQSRQYLNFFKNKIKTYTYKLYDEIGYKAGINFKVFTNLFPNATEQILKKNFREMKIEIDKNICYFTKLPNEDNQMLITPENVCQFESCQFGIYKLREVGIKNLTNPDKISYATNKFINQTQDLKQQFLGKVIEEELLTTPWNITQNFLQAKQIKGMLAIKGIGDPSNGQGGYSFLKMPVKTYNDNKTLKEEMDQLKTINKNIKTVTGTDADLRKLSKEDIKLKLIQLGEDEEYINKLSRWERVSLLRYKSSKAAELGYEGDITKYARGMRMNSKIQRDAYQKNINEVFKKQINYITNEHVYDFNYEDDSSEDEDKVIEEPKFNEEDKDKKSGLGFMRNEIYSNTLKKKKKSECRRLGIVPEIMRGKMDDKIIKVYSKNQNGNIFPTDDASTKIKFDMKNVDVEYLRRKKKNSQSFDNVYEYEIDKASTLISRKRRDTPEKIFNEMVEDIVDSCIKFDLTKLFHQPVKKKEYQDYYEIIKQPMDLGTMKNKTKRNEYINLNQFLDDVNLIVSNSSIYNGENHDVTLQANKIKTLALGKISENEDKFNDIQAKINQSQEVQN